VVNRPEPLWSQLLLSLLDYALYQVVHLLTAWRHPDCRWPTSWIYDLRPPRWEEGEQTGMYAVLAGYEEPPNDWETVRRKQASNAR